MPTMGGAHSLLWWGEEVFIPSKESNLENQFSLTFDLEKLGQNMGYDLDLQHQPTLTQGACLTAI